MKCRLGDTGHGVRGTITTICACGLVIRVVVVAADPNRERVESTSAMAGFIEAMRGHMSGTGGRHGEVPRSVQTKDRKHGGFGGHVHRQNEGK